MREVLGVAPYHQAEPPRRGSALTLCEDYVEGTVPSTHAYGSKVAERAIYESPKQGDLLGNRGPAIGLAARSLSPRMSSRLGEPSPAVGEAWEDLLGVAPVDCLVTGGLVSVEGSRELLHDESRRVGPIAAVGDVGGIGEGQQAR